MKEKHVIFKSRVPASVSKEKAPPFARFFVFTNVYQSRTRDAPSEQTIYRLSRFNAKKLIISAGSFQRLYRVLLFM